MKTDNSLTAAQNLAATRTKHSTHNLGRLALWVVGAFVMAGCVTNDDLYADYRCVTCETNVAADTLMWEQAVYFVTDRAVLDDIETQRVDNNVLVLERYPDMKVVLTGHTDDRNSDDYNQALSERRVKAVRQRLMEQGVSLDDIVELANSEYSAMFPANSNDIERSTNRRVDMMLIDSERRPATLELSNVVSPIAPLKKDGDAKTSR